MADILQEEGEAMVKELCRTYRTNSLIFVRCDVRKEKDVEGTVYICMFVSMHVSGVSNLRFPVAQSYKTISANFAG